MEKGALIGQGRTAEIYEWGDHQVLKLFRDWCPPNWVDYEHRTAHIVQAVMQAAMQAAALAAPAVEGIIEDAGRRGIIYERVRGPSMLAVLRSKPWKAAAFGRQLAELQAAMHKHRAPDLPPWRERLEHEIRGSTVLTDLTKQAVLKALGQLPDGDVLCHGDFHPDNVILSEKGPVVLDWMTAKRGNPLTDVARTSLILSNGQAPREMSAPWLLKLIREMLHSAYMRRYMQLCQVNGQDVERWRVPIAAARLSENIQAEKATLLKMIETWVLQPAQ